MDLSISQITTARLVVRANPAIYIYKSFIHQKTRSTNTKNTQKTHLNKLN